MGTQIDAKTGKVSKSEDRPPTPGEIESERQAIKRARAEAYRAEADPLFFKWQAGDATEQEWLEARNAVREKYPIEGP